MKQKVLAQLRTLYASKGLSKEELESLAEALAKNLTEESTDEDVSNAASGASPYVELMQKMGNRMVTAATKKYEGYVSPTELAEKIKQAKEQKEPPVEEKPKGLTQEEIQNLITEGIAAGLKPYQEEKEKARLASLLLSDERVKKVPEAFRKSYVLEKEEDLESVASKMEADWTTTKQSLIRDGVFAAPPETGNHDTETDELIEKMHRVAESETKK